MRGGDRYHKAASGTEAAQKAVLWVTNSHQGGKRKRQARAPKDRCQRISNIKKRWRKQWGRWPMQDKELLPKQNLPRGF